MKDALDILTEPATRSFFRSAKDRPFIGLLGPRGSGKSLFLKLINEAIVAGWHGRGLVQLTVDLNTIEIGESDDMFDRLVGAIGVQSSVAGFDGKVESNGGAGFSEIITELTGRIGNGALVIYIDSFDAPPRYFARDLSRRLRSLWEDRANNPDLGKLSVIFTGALSIFNLKHESDSAFAVSEWITLPLTDRKAKLTFLSQVLQRYGFIEGVTLDDAAMEVLLSETGGEPGFVRPLFQVLFQEQVGTESITGKRIDNAVNDLGPLIGLTPVIREITLNLAHDARLQDVVEKLCFGASYVPPVGPMIDIDPLQLLGAVVLDTSGAFSSYRFRNNIVGRVCRLLVGEKVKGIRMPVSVSRLKSAAKGDIYEFISADLPVGRIVGELEILRREVLVASNVWEVLETLREAWNLVSESVRLAEIHAYLCVPRLPIGSNRQLVHGLHGRARSELELDTSVTLLRSPAEDDVLRRALVVTLFKDRSFLAKVGERLIISLPCQGRGVAVALVCFFSSEGFQLAYLDKWVRIWCRWIEEVEPMLVLHALAETGANMIESARTMDDVQTLASRCGVGRRNVVEGLRDDIEASLERKVAVGLWLFRSLLLFGIGGCSLSVIYWAHTELIPLLKEVFPFFESHVVLIPVAGSVLITIAVFFGFRDLLLRLRNAVEGRLKSWIQERFWESDCLEVVNGLLGELDGEAT